MSEYTATRRAVGRACSERWQNLRFELSDLNDRLRDAVIDIITRWMSATTAEAIHCVLRRRPSAYRAKPSYRSGDADDWNVVDSDWQPSEARDASVPAAAGLMAVKTALWWLLRQGAILPAMLFGLAAGAVALLGGAEILKGLRHAVELLWFFGERFGQ